MKCHLVILSALFLAFNAFGQNANNVPKCQLTPNVALERPCVGIVFPENVHNFGKVSIAGGLLVHHFEFINTSQTDVFIIGSLTSCGCTKVTYPKTAIRPFAKGHVTVTYDPVGYPKGELNRRIRLETTGAQQFVPIWIKADIY